MIRSSIYRIFLQNLPFGGKDKLASAVFIKDNIIPTISGAPTPNAAPPVVCALSFAAQYLEDDF